MSGLWIDLLPLAVGGAVVPAQILVAVLLLQSGGASVLAGFVGGMTAVRLVQGLVFGLLVTGAAVSGGEDEVRTLASVALLILGILLLAAAARKATTGDDPDAPPQAWMARIGSLSGAGAAGLGALLIGVGAKFWVFTLGAISLIGAAGLEPGAATVSFLLFVALSQAIPLSLLLIAVASPRRSAVVVAGVSAWLERHQRTLIILVGLVFGTWFTLRGLAGLGVI